MYEHHLRDMESVRELFEQDQSVEALLFGGSVGHGYALPNSDIDIMIIVSDEEYRQRVREGRDLYINRDICTYEGGYVDGKYVSREFMKQVSINGSDPARYAFYGDIIGFSRKEGLQELIDEILTYPEELRQNRINMFYSEAVIWHWYAREGFRHNNSYLATTSITKMTLFAARLVLAHNRVFYPYHKWVMEELKRAPLKPEGIVECIERALELRTPEPLIELEEMLTNYENWKDAPIKWNGRYDRPIEFPWEDNRERLDYA